MPDDNRTSTRALRQIAEAANALSVDLLQRTEWFRATELMKETGVDRGVIRSRARSLAKLDLLDEREIVGAPRRTLEWRVSPTGERVLRLIEGWLGNATMEAAEPPRYLGLFAITSHTPLGGQLPDELIARLHQSSIAQLVPAVVFEEKR